MKKFLRTIFVVLVCIVSVFLFKTAEKASAYGVISDISVANSVQTESEFSNYTINFQNQTALSRYGGRINIDFFGPYSSQGSNFDFSSISIDSASTPASTFSSFGYGYQSVNVSLSKSLPAGSSVSLVLKNIKNPAQSGKYFVHIWTSSWGYEVDGGSSFGKDYPSSAFEIGDNTNLTGTVTSSSGAAVAYSYVMVYSSNWTKYYYTYTDKDGVYGIGDIPAGSYTVSLSAPPTTSDGTSYIPPAPSTVTIASSGTTTKNIAFQSANKTISGTITRSGGGAVTDARIYAYRMGTGGYVEDTTDSSGNYSFKVSGGTWYLYYYPISYPADWQATGSGVNITFPENDSEETKTLNFSAQSLNSTVSGRLVTSSGAGLSSYSAGISFFNTEGYSFWGNPDSNGYFSVKITSGTYSVSGWSNSGSYSFPKVENFAVGENATKDLGSITMVDKTDQITGYVKDNYGNGISGAYVSAWKNDGAYDWGSATTSSDGSYTIYVTPGNWQVSTWPQWDSGYVYSGGTKSVTVVSGTVATQNFTFLKCTSTIQGTITDPDGNLLSTLYAYASANDGGQSMWLGAPIQQGSFTMKVPAGTFNISAYIYGSDYDSPDPATVTIGENESKSITMKAVRNDAVLQGTIYDEDGQAVTGQWMSLYATKGQYASWNSATFDSATGTYTMPLSAGDWRLGWWIDPSTGYSSGNSQEAKVSIASGETKTHNITLKKLNATISGTTKKSNGDAMQWMWVTADTRNPKEKTSSDLYYYSNGASSNASGNFSMRIPAGTYWVGGNNWYGSGYLNPKRQQVTVEKDGVANVDLVFRQSDATIGGKVTRDGNGVNAYITAWSDDGAYAETTSNNEGNYTINISKDTVWHIRAIQEVDKKVYKSRQYIKDMTGTTSAVQDLELAKQDYTLPDSVTVTFDATVQQSVTLEDGTIITIPASAIASSGTITLVIEPIADLAEEQDAKPLDYGYEMHAYDQSGREITQFNSEITIQDPYTSAMLEESNIEDENELMPAYYDETAGTWQVLNNAVVDEDKNTVTYQTDHFTKYALVSAADTSPPSAPSGVSVISSTGKISLYWTNATEADLDSVKIYRSETRGQIGSVLTTLPKTAISYEDTGVTAGSNYYYTLRSLDRSSNESINTDQVGGQASSSLPKTGRTNNPNNILLDLLYSNL